MLASLGSQPSCTFSEGMARNPQRLRGTVRAVLTLTLRPVPCGVKGVPLKGGRAVGVKGQALKGARELQREVFNEQQPVCMEIVFHTPLSSLMPSGEGSGEPICVCMCVQVTLILVVGGGIGAGRVGEELGRWASKHRAGMNARKPEGREDRACFTILLFDLL